ncbi:MAG: EAL domain-containing protein [Actinobacteria bacterium]|nr:EAL domain-containing protein [Actinomycetota bacterium]
MLHRLPGSPSDLLTFARFWAWERVVAEELPDTLSHEDVSILFQPIFGLDDLRPRAYEALARFPRAPQIPVGLWFRTAWEHGLGHDLESVAARKAIQAAEDLKEPPLIFLNMSLASAAKLCDELMSRPTTPVAFDMRLDDLDGDEARPLLEQLKEAGAKVSVDDVPLEDLHGLMPAICRVAPDFVKVDVLPGLHDTVMGRFNLADAAAWCRESRIRLIAERVESRADLPRLRDLGVDWAQGYALARPGQTQRPD